MLSTRQYGLSLIELMVAMVLGLVVVGGALSIFLSNRQTYRATENLGRIQENARVAFELMSRDLRQAGGNPCDDSLPIANTLNNASTAWWANFATGLRGYDEGQAFAGAAFGTAVRQRVAGTDAIELHFALDGDVGVADHQAPSAQIKLNTKDHGIADGDIIAICDFEQVAITQITNAQPGTNVTVVHNEGSAVTPGNCTKSLLAGPNNCDFKCASGGPGASECKYFPPNSRVARMQARAWYVGNSTSGDGRSLYQIVLRNSGGTTQPVAQEIADGVQDMQLEFLQQGAAGDAYQSAATVTDWSRVVATRIILTLEGPEAVDGEPLEREFQHVVTLRNRL